MPLNKEPKLETLLTPNHSNTRAPSGSNFFFFNIKFDLFSEVIKYIKKKQSRFQ